jgi:hypothetical protein
VDLHHVLYEIQMLVDCSRKLATTQHSDCVTHNALVESRALHARNLIDFFTFTRETAREDDLVSSDFGLPTAPISNADQIRRRVGKQVAHLTMERFLDHEADSKAWSQHELRPLLERCCDFLAHLGTKSVPNLVLDPELQQRQHGLLETLRDFLIQLASAGVDSSTG